MFLVNKNLYFFIVRIEYTYIFCSENHNEIRIILTLELSPKNEVLKEIWTNFNFKKLGYII